jgi:hypothetical protein
MDAHWPTKLLRQQPRFESRELSKPLREHSYLLSRGEVLGLVVESHHSRELQVLQHGQLLNILRFWGLTALRARHFRLINKQYRALRPTPKTIAVSLLISPCHSMYTTLYIINEKNLSILWMDAPRKTNFLLPHRPGSNLDSQ